MKRIITITILLLFLVIPIVNAEEKTSAKFEMENIVLDENDINTLFSYEIKSEGENPLPTSELIFLPNEKKVIVIEYNKVGNYTYYIEQKTQDSDTLKLDKSKYIINIKVEKNSEGKLKNIVWIDNENGEKVEKVSYKNIRIKTIGSNPITGDINLKKYITIMIVSLIVTLIIIIFLIKNNKNKK